MQCHKPGHRAPARCVSALLAAGALLAAAVDQLGTVRPAMQATALDVPTMPATPVTTPTTPTPTPSPATADTPALTQPSPLTRPPSWSSSVARHHHPVRSARKVRRAAKAKAKTKAKAWAHRHGSKTTHPKHGPPSRWTGHRHQRWHRPAPGRHSGSTLLAHLPPAGNTKAAVAVHEALSLLGVPYRWGGTTRAGFDCSGFTQHVWAAAGVKIPRTVREQARAGTHIPLNKAEPGDLVVFYPTQHHVGLYVGDGVVIDSPHTGSSVRPDPVHSMPVSVVVRVHS